MSTQRENIFISYCREDDEWRKMFRTMLAPLVQKEQLKIWDDTNITPNTKWSEEIEKAVASSKLALLLVTADFLGSDFIVNYELPLLIRAQANGLIIAWVAVSPSIYRYTGLKDYEVLNDPATPLDTFSKAKLKQEMVKVCEKIKSLLDTPSE